MTMEEHVKSLSDEELKRYAETAEQYLIDNPEPEIIKGRSRVRKWAAMARKELKNRGL